MINIDLSRPLSSRIFIYLLALIPGLFFFFSVVLGNPALAKSALSDYSSVFQFPHYVLYVAVVGISLFFGQAIVLAALLVEIAVWYTFLAGRWCFRKAFGGPKEHELEKIETEVKAASLCLRAATGKLLNTQYGIDPLKDGVTPNGPSWSIWCWVVGKPPKDIRESRNFARILQAIGLGGFVAQLISPYLINRYYVTMCIIFLFNGLASALSYLYVGRHPVGRIAVQLRAILAATDEANSKPEPPTTK